MSNGPDEKIRIKKMLNNSRLRADIGRVLEICSLAEENATVLGGPAVVRLCNADRDLRDAISVWKERYDSELDATESGLARQLAE